MNDLTNIDMSDFWNGSGGENWMRFHEQLEKSLNPFGMKAISTAMIKSGERVLDVGCGWGDTSFNILQSVGIQGQVHGIDISNLILQHAGNRVDASGHKNISFECVDAESHSFDSMVFDIIYSRFGVMFFSNPVEAFKNIRKTLKPDGRLVFVCWQSIQANQWVNLPLEIAKNHVFIPPPTNPDAPGGFSFGDDSRVKRILDEAGFVNTKIQPFSTKFTVGENIEDAMTFLSNIGPASSVLDDPEIDNVIKQHITSELRETLASYKTLNGVQLDAATWIVTASNQ